MAQTQEDSIPLSPRKTQMQRTRERKKKKSKEVSPTQSRDPRRAYAEPPLPSVRNEELVIISLFVFFDHHIASSSFHCYHHSIPFITSQQFNPLFPFPSPDNHHSIIHQPQGPTNKECKKANSHHPTLSLPSRVTSVIPLTLSNVIFPQTSPTPIPKTKYPSTTPLHLPTTPTLDRLRDENIIFITLLV